MTRNTTIGAALALLTLAAGSCLGQGTPCVGWYFTRTKEVSHPCSQFCAPHTHKWPALVKLKCDYATHACDGTVVRREDVTIVCVPREYGPRAHLVDSAGYSAAYYSLLRRFPEEQLQAMLRGQVVPEGAWPPSAKSVARRLFHKEAFVPSRVEMEVKSQAGLLAWLEEVHGRPRLPRKWCRWRRRLTAAAGASRRCSHCAGSQPSAFGSILPSTCRRQASSPTQCRSSWPGRRLRLTPLGERTPRASSNRRRSPRRRPTNCSTESWTRRRRGSPRLPACALEWYTGGA